MKGLSTGYSLYEICTNPADYVILTSVSIVGRNRDRIAWKFYYDPQVFKSLGRGTHEKKISGGDHYDVNISHDRFESAYDDGVCCSQKTTGKAGNKEIRRTKPQDAAGDQRS